MLLMHLGMTYKIWCSTWLYRFNVKVQWEISKTRVKLLQSSVCEKLLNSSQFWLDYVQSEIKNGRLENKMCVSTQVDLVYSVSYYMCTDKKLKRTFSLRKLVCELTYVHQLLPFATTWAIILLSILIFMLDLFKRILRPRPNFRRP